MRLCVVNIGANRPIHEVMNGILQVSTMEALSIIWSCILPKLKELVQCLLLSRVTELSGHCKSLVVDS